MYVYKNKEVERMGSRRVRASSAKAAKRKASGKNTACSKVNYIPGTKKGRMKTYRVYTHKRKK